MLRRARQFCYKAHNNKKVVISIAIVPDDVYQRMSMGGIDGEEKKYRIDFSSAPSGFRRNILKKNRKLLKERETRYITRTVSFSFLFSEKREKRRS